MQLEAILLLKVRNSDQSFTSQKQAFGRHRRFKCHRKCKWFQDGLGAAKYANLRQPSPYRVPVASLRRCFIEDGPPAPRLGDPRVARSHKFLFCPRHRHCAVDRRIRCFPELPVSGSIADKLQQVLLLTFLQQTTLQKSPTCSSLRAWGLCFEIMAQMACVFQVSCPTGRVCASLRQCTRNVALVSIHMWQNL